MAYFISSVQFFRPVRVPIAATVFERTRILHQFCFFFVGFLCSISLVIRDIRVVINLFPPYCTITIKFKRNSYCHKVDKRKNKNETYGYPKKESVVGRKQGPKNLSEMLKTKVLYLIRPGMMQSYDSSFYNVPRYTIRSIIKWNNASNTKVHFKNQLESITERCNAILNVTDKAGMGCWPAVVARSESSGWVWNRGRSPRFHTNLRDEAVSCHCRTTTRLSTASGGRNDRSLEFLKKIVLQ